MPREGHGSRNSGDTEDAGKRAVMPREGHGSRNLNLSAKESVTFGHAPRGAWE